MGRGDVILADRLLDRRPLPSDQRGAVLVIGVFMAVMMVGLLYHVVSVGESIIYKEYLQDAADASAFHAAVIHARSMNTIGLMNLIQLVLYGVLMALTHASQLNQACSAGAYTGETPFVFCPGEQGRMDGADSENRGAIVSLLARTNAAAESIRDYTPELTTEEVERTVAEYYGKYAVTGVFVEREMPLSTASARTFCPKAYVYMDAMVRAASPDTYSVLDTRAPFVVRYDFPECNQGGAEAYGPQLMNPANQVGSEPLQVRVFVMGDDSFVTSVSEGAELPSRSFGREGGASTNREWISEAELAPAIISIAQAEYYTNFELANLPLTETTDTMVEETTFHMHWLARLRRVRVPVDVAPTSHHASFRDWVIQEVIPACDSACVGRPCEGRCLTLGGIFAEQGNAVIH